MIIFKLEDFATDGIIREKEFREKIESHDWSQYRGKVVLLQGCSRISIPLWGYLIAAIQLSRHAKRVSFGEPHTMIPICDAAKENAEANCHE